jgi:tRNA threonylcarbamoyladenosine biosynthesis protein TsaE
VADAVPGAVARVVTWSAEDTEALGRRLATVLRAGDLLVLSGDLGAGKTTLARGLGAGLGIRGPVTSPTFVIAREHPSIRGGPALLHVDAYRLGEVAELEDLDLQTSLDAAVTVVEWGEGLAEGLAANRLEVRLQRPHGGVHGDEVGEVGDAARRRTVELRAVGERWLGVDLDAVLRPPRNATAG